MKRRRLFLHALALWCVAPLLLSLSVSRPAGGDKGRARALPLSIGDFRFVREDAITPHELDLLGTTDAVRRRFARADGTVFLTAVFHDENWKSVHAPDTCLRGGGMQTLEESEVGLPTPLGSFPVGRFLMSSDDPERRYLCLFAFVAAPDYVTGNYWSFFFHHLPRALFRENVSGCLVRVESWVSGESVEAVEQRCRDLMSDLLPLVLESLR